MSNPVIEQANTPGNLALQKKIFVFLSIVLLTFTVLKAILIEFTPDEIYTWQHYGSHLLFFPDSYDHMSANNHWLNSLLMHASAALFGDSSFALRLPTLFAHACYLFFTAKIILDRKLNDLAALSFFVVLNVHPYLLDFFMLARGYGLSIAFMTGALYYANRFITSDASKQIIFRLAIISSLAVLSNFVLLDFLIPFVFLLTIFILTEKTTQIEKIKRITLLIFPSMILLIFILPHLTKMQSANSLYYGSSSLWEGTTKTLANQLMYEAPYGGSNFFSTLKPAIYLALATILFTAIIGIGRNGLLKWLKLSPTFFVLVFAGTLLMLVVQNILTGALFPFQRTGLFLFILFLFALLFSIESWSFKKTTTILSTAFACILLIHMILRANMSYALEWKPSGGISVFLEKITAERLRLEKPVPTISISTGGVSGISLEYEAKKENMYWLKVNQCWEGGLQPADFYLIEGKERPKTLILNWEKIDSCEANGNVLYVDKTFLRKQRPK